MRLALPAREIRSETPGLVWTLIAGAWLLAFTAQVTGNAVLLHHHTLIENGPPLWMATILFLLGWQVMVAAMMLPASLETIGMVKAKLRSQSSGRAGLVTFLGVFALIWSAFGLFAFAGDFIVHHVVDASPWVSHRPWLVEAGVVALAGGYQLAPIKRLSLAACRHPFGLFERGSASVPSAGRLGLEHGLWCLGSSGALMLLMFAEGFGNLWWMVAMTGVMVYEIVGKHGFLAARIAGVALLAFASVILLSGGITQVV
jgi:predicted metal-binding membrane protein